MNIVILIGRLTKDADYRQGKKNVARFTLAENSFKNDANFLSCVAFDKNADLIKHYTHRGSQIAIEGRLKTGSYTKESGEKVYTTDVIVNKIKFLDKKEDNASADFQPVADTFESDDLPFN